MNENESTRRIQGIDFAPAVNAVTIEGESISLTVAECGVLHFLASNARTTFTRQQIIEAVQGVDYPATDRTVDVQIHGLRKKLGTQAKLIETVRGLGYRFRTASACDNLK